MRTTITMIVCLCEGVSDREIRGCVQQGAYTVEAIGRACGAGTGCGSCHEMLGDLIVSERGRAPCEEPTSLGKLLPAVALP